MTPGKKAKSNRPVEQHGWARSTAELLFWVAVAYSAFFAIATWEIAAKLAELAFYLALLCIAVRISRW